ncbi:MAG TPA: amidohydrolase family protein [Anaerolineae bacterium]|nr:amidohydrolase family protein [Anaerolineae bacterium]
MGQHSSLAITNGNALLPTEEIHTGDVLIEKGRIAEVGRSLTADVQIDARGGYVLPGFIDVHTHGIRTVNLQDGKLQEYASIEASFGTTTFYPTLFDTPEAIAEQMRRHRAETDELRLVPQVGGFRLESPYLARTGAGLAKDLGNITSQITTMLMKAGGGHIKIWDVSPELDGAPEVIEDLSGQGIVCSIAHTQATIEQGRAAVDAGARLVTHLFDVFLPPEDTGTGVYPHGLVDYLLIEDRVKCEIIGDGTHVPDILVEKAFRCKTPDGLVFVTDSNFGAGLPPGQYDAGGSWGRIQIDGPNNGARMVDRDMGLAGSALTPIDAFRNAIRLFNKTMGVASRVCSRNPARLLALNKGEIAPGRDADLIVLDQDLGLRYTIVAGQIVYQEA